MTAKRRLLECQARLMVADDLLSYDVGQELIQQTDHGNSATFGYDAITPTSVITILITPAKMGRSMKKCEIRMPAPTEFWPAGRPGRA